MARVALIAGLLVELWLTDGMHERHRKAPKIGHTNYSRKLYRKLL